ncbi:MAG: UDP-N-acetylmuramoyl-tripeptide--D-alanyl-D-alanine ligase [Thermodesulfobacteriota bacterium]
MNEPMHAWNLGDVLSATGGELLHQGAESFSAVALDSRNIGKAELFVAIAGEIHDGHRFVSEVVARGAGGVVIRSDRRQDLDMELVRRAKATVIAVGDTVAALGALGSFRLRRCGSRVCAITGTNGKTTTKEMCAAIFGRKFATAKNAGNFNNHIGVPLTLLALTPEIEWVITEMGMNHPGEIAYLASLARPDIGIVTNVGPGHLEGVGSLAGVIAAKRELIEGMEGGTAVLLADDENVISMGRAFSGRVLTFGFSEEADVRAEDLRQEDTGTAFTLSLSGCRHQARIAAFGRHMVQNACAAAAAGMAAGVPGHRIVEGLAGFAPVAGRLTVRRLADGITVLDDTYNANPSSMAASLDTLSALASGNRTVAALGEMRELGAHAASEHFKLGKTAAGHGLFRLFVAGPYAGQVEEGALSAGMAPEAVVTGDRDEIAEQVKALARPGDFILVKGSRLSAMENVVKRLTNP